ncbi:MAG: hypothetical protein EA362_12480 [Saprospirales bacterium]|nr:MAG: hypothetical protein EA362_12480 [Saprospirales bacterium]
MISDTGIFFILVWFSTAHQHPTSERESVFLSCWWIEVESNQVHYKLLSSNYLDAFSLIYLTGFVIRNTNKIKQSKTPVFKLFYL